jgi:hypothetical protein
MRDRIDLDNYHDLAMDPVPYYYPRKYDLTLLKKIAIVGSTTICIISILFVLFASKSPSKTISAPPKIVTTLKDPGRVSSTINGTFDERATSIVAKQSPPPSMEPRIVPITRVTPDPQPIINPINSDQVTKKVKDMESKPTKPIKVVEKEEPEERNVCTRHHMRKVMIRGGRSWRCRR